MWNFKEKRHHRFSSILLPDTSILCKCIDRGRSELLLKDPVTLDNTSWGDEKCMQLPAGTHFIIHRYTTLHYTTLHRAALHCPAPRIMWVTIRQ